MTNHIVRKIIKRSRIQKVWHRSLYWQINEIKRKKLNFQELGVKKSRKVNKMFREPLPIEEANFPILTCWYNKISQCKFEDQSTFEPYISIGAGMVTFYSKPSFIQRIAAT